MMKPPLRNVLLMGAFMLCVEFLFVGLRLKSTGVNYYRIVRMHVLVNMEFMMLLGSAFIYWRLTSSLSNLQGFKLQSVSNRWRTICLHDVFRALLALFLVLAHLAFVFYFVMIGTEPTTIAYISLVSMALYLHVFFFLIIAEGIHYLSAFSGRIGVLSRLSKYISDNRDAYALLALGCALMLVLVGVFTTSRPPVVVHQPIEIQKFTSKSSPVHIALLTDIHIGPSVGRKRMETIVNVTNGLYPDIIAISGDLADGFVRDLGVAAKPLCNLKAKYGVFFATGNHEYMHGNVEEWFQFLMACGINILHNENQRIDLPSNDTICIAGVDDLYAARAHMPGHGMNPQKALSGCLETDAVVVLAHQPNAARTIFRDPTVNGNIDLVLSGHTHAGQMYMFVPIVYIANAFSHGLYDYPLTKSQIYVSAGVNFFGPPVKMFGTCEVIHIELISPTQ